MVKIRFTDPKRADEGKDIIAESGPVIVKKVGEYIVPIYVTQLLKERGIPFEEISPDLPKAPSSEK
jgi:hypothetical protein